MLQKRIVAADCDELVALEELEEPILIIIIRCCRLQVASCC